MTLHIPSLAVALLIGCLLLAAQLGFAQRRLPGRGPLRLWTQGCWMVIAAFPLIASRLFVPPWLAVLTGNTVLLVGLGCYVRALYSFVFDRELPRPGWWLLGAGLLIVAASAFWPLHLRTPVLSLVYAVPLLHGALVVWRGGPVVERSLHLVAGSMVVCAWRCCCGPGTHCSIPSSTSC